MTRKLGEGMVKKGGKGTKPTTPPPPPPQGQGGKAILGKREFEVAVFNKAEDAFHAAFPHVPIMTDDDPLFPKESLAFKKKVMPAIRRAVEMGFNWGQWAGYGCS